MKWTGLERDSTILAPMRDEDLLMGIAEGDQDAFLAFHDRFAPRVLGLLHKVLQDTAEAEDVFQEVMLEIWKKASSFDRTLGPASTWVLMMARARGIDRLRRRGRDQARLAALRDARPPEETTSPAAVWESDTVGIDGALDRLSREQRTLIELAFFGGLTREQIAEATGLPVGTVKSRIRAGVQRLRAILPDAVTSPT